jgi:Zn finger protein HypA/HybF involved in hydrogenase expression
MAHDHLANCTCYVLTLEPIDQFTLRYGAHNQACPVYRESGDYLDQKRDIEARARLESLPTSQATQCEICGDERKPEDLNGELLCPPCVEREEATGRTFPDLEDAHWQETIEARQDGTDLDTWPKRCPFTGGEIDEDGSDSCPDDCQHHRSAEFTADQEPDPGPPTYTPTDDEDTADQARLAALDTYPAVTNCRSCGKLFEPDRHGDDICADC